MKCKNYLRNIASGGSITENSAARGGSVTAGWGGGAFSTSDNCHLCFSCFSHGNFSFTIVCEPGTILTFVTGANLVPSLGTLLYLIVFALSSEPFSFLS